MRWPLARSAVDVRVGGGAATLPEYLRSPLLRASCGDRADATGGRRTRIDHPNDPLDRCKCVKQILFGGRRRDLPKPRITSVLASRSFASPFGRLMLLEEGPKGGCLFGGHVEQGVAIDLIARHQAEP